MLLSTTDTIVGKKIAKQLGPAKGNTIRARHIGRDIMAILRHIAGGEITDWVGAPVSIETERVIAGNNTVHGEFLRLLDEAGTPLGSFT